MKKYEKSISSIYLRFTKKSETKKVEQKNDKTCLMYKKIDMIIWLAF